MFGLLLCPCAIAGVWRISFYRSVLRVKNSSACLSLCKDGCFMTLLCMFKRCQLLQTNTHMQSVKHKGMGSCVWVWAGAQRRERSNVWQCLWLNIRNAEFYAYFTSCVEEWVTFGNGLCCNLNWWSWLPLTTAHPKKSLHNVWCWILNLTTKCSFARGGFANCFFFSLMSQTFQTVFLQWFGHLLDCHHLVQV